MIRAEEITKWEKEKEKPKGNHYFAYMVFVITLITLSAKTHDTKGLDLDTVTGCEWD